MKSKYCIKTTMLPFCMALLLSVFAMQSGFAQEQSQFVSGNVKSADDGMGIPGASVAIEGTKTATSTDFDGNFKLDAKTGNVIVISFMGFKTQRITVGAQKMINVTLQTEAADLKEVVVIGYGSQKKTLVTNAVTQVSGDNLAKTNTTNALQALQG